MCKTMCHASLNACFRFVMTINFTDRDFFSIQVATVGFSPYSAPSIIKFYHLGVRDRCSVHLINDGITRLLSSSEIFSVTTFEWGLSAPSDVMRSAVSFNCSFNGGQPSNCKLLVTCGKGQSETGQSTSNFVRHINNC